MKENPLDTSAAEVRQVLAGKRRILEEWGAPEGAADPELAEYLVAPLPEDFEGLLNRTAAWADSTGVRAGTRFGLLKRLAQRILRVHTAGQTQFNHSAMEAIRLLSHALRGSLDAVNRLTRENHALRRRVMDLERTARPGPPPGPRPAALGAASYVAFEERFRGSEDDILLRVRPYAQAFRQIIGESNGALDGRPVVDLGCGRGELLEALRDEGIPARGLDQNPHLVALCRSKSLEVAEGEALTGLDQVADGSLAGVAAIQMIEHLAVEDIARLFELARRKLRPEGALILETINPDSLHGLRWFRLDWTHSRPVPPDLARFLLGQCGFGRIEVHPVAPVDESLRMRETGDERADENFRRINEQFLGHQDYAIVARPR